MKTPHTITLYRRTGKPKYDPITDTHTEPYDEGKQTPCLANYVAQERVFELYGDRNRRVLIVRFNQEQPPFDRAEYQGRYFVPIEHMDAPIKGAVRLKEVQADG